MSQEKGQKICAGRPGREVARDMENSDHLIMDTLIHVQFHALVHLVIMVVLEVVVAPGRTLPLLEDAVTTRSLLVEGLLIDPDHPGILHAVMEMPIDHILRNTMIEMKLQMGELIVQLRKHEIREVFQGDCQDHHLDLGLDLLMCLPHEVDDEQWHDDEMGSLLRLDQLWFEDLQNDYIYYACPFSFSICDNQNLKYVDFVLLLTDESTAFSCDVCLCSYFIRGYFEIISVGIERDSSRLKPKGPAFMALCLVV